MQGTVARVVADDASRLPVLALWDFAAAFPGLAHDWLMLVIRRSGLPVAFSNFIRAMYYMNGTYVNVPTDFCFCTT